MSDAERIARLEIENKELRTENKKLSDKVWDMEINIREMQQGAQRVLGTVNNFVLNMTHPGKNKATA